MEPRSSGSVLVVDDDDDLIALVAATLEEAGFQVTSCNSAAAALSAMQSAHLDAVLTDLNMPGMNGIDFCERAVASHPDVPVVLVTAHARLEVAVAALRAGAEDFITKPIDPEILIHRVRRAVNGRMLRCEVVRLRQAAREAGTFPEIIGKSPAMTALFDLLERVRESSASVLCTGESGTGKELIARALHVAGSRRNGPYVAINCSAMPAALLESELFGHAKGAFTDAREDKTGLFLQADGGTLLLDEIGEMPLPLQPKLLRALQERSVRPVGGQRETPFDVRIIAATNRDLESAVESGQFREDLFFRLNVIQVQLPPLRARGQDILLLAQRFLDEFASTEHKQVSGISAAAADKLLSYGWPGNVRELRNCMERAVVVARTTELLVADLPEKIRDYRRSHVLLTSDDPNELVRMEEIERRYIERVLQAVAGNKTLAAKTLGFDRKTLYRKLERYKLDRPE